MEQPSRPPIDPPTRAFFESIASRYAVDREIGRGGMGRVYLARDLRHSRDVAIKVLPHDIADAASKKRFLREIQIVASLNHPNILPLHDSGESVGRLYFVMPFVEGQSLRHLMRETGRVAPGRAIELACEVANALDYAHAKGVIHRDIKPENILLVHGHPVVADFGIARALGIAPVAPDESTAGPQTAGSQTVGTGAYMSPEQATKANVDGRSDIYSLAIVLREMLTGNSVPDAKGWGIPKRIERVVTSALAKDPSDRPPSAADFAYALRTSSEPRRRSWWLATAASIAVASLALAWSTGRHPSSPVVGAIRPHRVAVARFDADSATATDNVGLMAADWITEGLQRTAVVEVVPTVTAMQAWQAVKAARAPRLVRAFADETSAGVVITGSYYRVGDSLHIQAQVSDSDGTRILGVVGPITTSVSSPMQAIETLRTRVMGLLATNLDSNIASSLEKPGRPPTFEAYRAFSAGLENYVDSKFGPAGERFADAYVRDTSLVTALLMASISRSNVNDFAAADSLLEALAAKRDQLTPVDRDWFDHRRSLLAGDRPGALAAIRRVAAATPGTKATYNLAVEAMQNGAVTDAKRAFATLPTDRGPMKNWEPYWDVVSHLHHLSGEYDQEVRDGNKARALFPTRIHALLGLARGLGALGKSADVLRLIESAATLPPDPRGTTPGDLAFESGGDLLLKGRTDGGRDVLLRGLRWYDDHPPAAAKDTVNRLGRARILYALGQWRDCADSAEAIAAEGSNRPDALGLAGAAAARLGDHPRAKRSLSALERLPRRYSLGIPTFDQARVVLQLGMKDSAVALLRQSLAEGHEWDLWILEDIDFARLRGFAPFDLLARPKDATDR